MLKISVRPRYYLVWIQQDLEDGQLVNWKESHKIFGRNYYLFHFNTSKTVEEKRNDLNYTNRFMPEKYLLESVACLNCKPKKFWKTAPQVHFHILVVKFVLVKKFSTLLLNLKRKKEDRQLNIGNYWCLVLLCRYWYTIQPHRIYLLKLQYVNALWDQGKSDSIFLKVSNYWCY